MIERGSPVVARDLHVPPLEARLQAPSITRICVMFLSIYLLFFLKKVTWVFVYVYGMVTLFTAVLFMDSNNVVTVPTIL